MKEGPAPDSHRLPVTVLFFPPDLGRCLPRIRFDVVYRKTNETTPRGTPPTSLSLLTSPTLDLWKTPYTRDSIRGFSGHPTNKESQLFSNRSVRRRRPHERAPHLHQTKSVKGNCLSLRVPRRSDKTLGDPSCLGPRLRPIYRNEDTPRGDRPNPVSESTPTHLSPGSLDTTHNHFPSPHPPYSSPSLPTRDLFPTTYSFHTGLDHPRPHATRAPSHPPNSRRDRRRRTSSRPHPRPLLRFGLRLTG